MSGRVVLVPVMLMLALTAGCRSSSDDSAQADNGIAPATPILAAASVEPSPVQPAPVPQPVKPSPTVTVRAQPAPRNPLDLPPSDDGLNAEPFPQEVTSFMVDRDGCDHFRGELPYDAERRAYIAESVAELCTGTDARLAMLRRRYANDPSVIAALKTYDDRIESAATY
ncbi:hypothetical protein [Sphingobium sp.]|uniref:hypothetical protein n=1 Tax=Sphingobium sp. TaxID=1912891 RepID=UPI00262CD874|nr:hypothetical protein [Sphingobium sp.]